MTLRDLVDPVLSGGAIVLCLYALYWAWRTTRDKIDLTEQRLKLLRMIMAFSLSILVISGALEIAKRFIDIKKDAITQVALDAFLGTAFEPHRSESTGTFSYVGRAPAGLDREVATNPVFQDFSTHHTVQRMWADPRYPNSLIRAVKVIEGENGLLIEFIRLGWGCDVTVKQKDNKAVYTETFSTLAIVVHADSPTLKELHATGAKGIGLRVRIVDERGNHWSWGTPKQHQGVVWVDYDEKDSSGQELTLPNPDRRTFTFDISDRKRWAIFKSDGSIAPIQLADERFRFVQMIVIEPGVAGITPADTGTPSESYEHTRNLGDSPKDATGSLLRSKMIVRKIYFK